MAYEKHIWENGEVISAEKLNNLEEGIGYEVTEELTVVFEDSLDITESAYSPSGTNYIAIINVAKSIDSDFIIVKLNGIDYTLPKETSGFGYGESSTQGGPIFTNYPCYIIPVVDTDKQYLLCVQQSGTYNIKINVPEISIEVSNDFKKAVEKTTSLKNIKDSGANSIIENDLNSNKATGVYSHAEGSYTIASGNLSHAEGDATTASGSYSHAEGGGTIADGEWSHAEGNGSNAQGNNSHAEGVGVIARGECSHANGYDTRAQGFCQTVIGQYNISQGTSDSNTSTDYAFIIGNGTSNARSNALAIKWDGTFVFANGTEILPEDFASLLNLLSNSYA